MITGPEPEYTYGADPDFEEPDANEMLQWELEEALREALTKGVSLKSMQILCHGTGVPYARVVG